MAKSLSRNGTERTGLHIGQVLIVLGLVLTVAWIGALTAGAVRAIGMIW